MYVYVCMCVCVCARARVFVCVGGHLTAKRTQERIWTDLYWPGMCGDIRRYCTSCDQCPKMSPRDISVMKSAGLDPGHHSSRTLGATLLNLVHEIHSSIILFPSLSPAC